MGAIYWNIWILDRSYFVFQVVKAKVKDLFLPRYKIISLVHIGQLQDQGLRMGSREEPRQRAHSGRLLFRRRSHFQRMFMSLDGSMIGRRLLAARTASTTGNFAKCMRQMTLVAPARCAPALQ